MGGVEIVTAQDADVARRSGRESTAVACSARARWSGIAEISKQDQSAATRGGDHARDLPVPPKVTRLPHPVPFGEAREDRCRWKRSHRPRWVQRSPAGELVRLELRDPRAHVAVGRNVGEVPERDFGARGAIGVGEVGEEGVGSSSREPLVATQAGLGGEDAEHASP